MKGSHTFPGIALLCVLILTAPGCGKKTDAPAPAPAAQSKGGVSVDGATEAVPSPPPAGEAPAAAASTTPGRGTEVDDSQTIQAPGTLPQPEVMLRIIAKYNQQFGRPPASTDDLVRANLMNKLPTLDPSLRYKLDVQAGTLEIVNK